MKQPYLRYILLVSLTIQFMGLTAQESLELNDKEYFHTRGLDVTVFSDYYPEEQC